MDSFNGIGRSIMKVLSNSVADAAIKENLKKDYSINSRHKVIASFNLNSSLTMDDFGVYSSSTLNNSYSKGTNYSTGKHKLYYNSISSEGLVEELEVEDPSIDRYYSLIDCFNPFRPTAGVVRPIAAVKSSSTPMFYMKSLADISNNSQSINKVYLASFTTTYKYWTSAMYGNVNGVVPGISSLTPTSGSYPIQTVNGKGRVAPFIAYTTSAYANSIVVKYQTHLGVPDNITVQILNDENAWITVYTENDETNLPLKDSNGLLELYYDYSDNLWKRLTSQFSPKLATDFVSDGTFNQAVKVKGVRLLVNSMSAPNIPFELIELSAKLNADLTDYVMSATYESGIEQSTVGLPVGGIVLGSGSIQLSNAELSFINTNSNSLFYQLIDKNVQFFMYHGLLNDSTYYYYPMGVLYSGNWTESEDVTITVETYDFMKILQTTKASDIFIGRRNVSPVTAIQVLLNNEGWTNFRILGNTSDLDNIEYFFTNSQSTIAEVLNEIAIATQSAIFIDSSGNLTIATKDYMMNPSKTASWYLTTEDIKISGDTITVKNNSISPNLASYEIQDVDYLSNIVNYTINKIDPINDGEVAYNKRSYKKLNFLPKDTFSKAKQLEIKAPFAESSREAVETVWTPGTGTEENVEGSADAIMNGSTLIEDMSASRPLNTTISIPTPSLINNNYSLITDFVQEQFLKANNINEAVKTVTVGALDTATFPYEGFIKIDGEIIRYKGIQFTKIPQRREQTVINKVSLSSNTLTVSTVSFHKYVAGDRIEISGAAPVSGVNYNGVYTVSAVIDSYQYTVSKTGSNFSATLVPENPLSTLSTSSQTYWIFNQEGKRLLESESSIGDVITLTGKLGIYCDFEMISQTPETTTYKVVLDGRGTLGTSVSSHTGFAQASSIPQGWTKKAFNLYSNSGQVESGGHVIDKTDSDYVLSNVGFLRSGGVVISGMSSGGELDESVRDNIGTTVMGDHNFKYASDLSMQGMVKTLDKAYKSFYLSYAHLRHKSKSESKAEKPSATSVIGLGIYVNQSLGTGYFAEISAVDDEDQVDQNFRFYKIYKDTSDGNKLKVATLYVGTVLNVYQSTQTDLGDLSTTNESPFLDLRIDVDQDGHTFTVVVANQQMCRVVDNDTSGVDKRLSPTNNVMAFVRGDAYAYFKKFSAKVQPNNRQLKLPSYLNTIAYDVKSDDFYRTVETNGSTYVESFGKEVNEVKVYNLKFSKFPVVSTVVVDLSPVGAGYTVEKSNLNSFTGNLILTNKTGRAIGLAPGTINQFSILGTVLRQQARKVVDLERILDESIDEYADKTTIINSRRKYGIKSFNFDSKFIQNYYQASKLLSWVLKKCNTPSKNINSSIFTNPVFEIGDYARVYSVKNDLTSANLFVINGITYSISPDGPSMNVKLREVK
jgi:hypothetical protein